MTPFTALLWSFCGRASVCLHAAAVSGRVAPAYTCNREEVIALLAMTSRSPLADRDAIATVIELLSHAMYPEHIRSDIGSVPTATAE